MYAAAESPLLCVTNGRWEHSTFELGLADRRRRVHYAAFAWCPWAEHEYLIAAIEERSCAVHLFDVRS